MRERRNLLVMAHGDARTNKLRTLAAAHCALLLAVAGSGCIGDATQTTLEGPNSIGVALQEGTLTGCEVPEGADRPTLLPYDKGWIKVRIAFTVLDALGQPYRGYNGRVGLTLLPGKVNPTYVTATDGQVGPVDVQIQGFGLETRLWAQAMDEGGREVAGVSPRFCFQNPLIVDVQTSDKSYRGPMNGRQVIIDRGTLVATGATTQGFFMSDVSHCRALPESGDASAESSRIDCSRSWFRPELLLQGTEWAEVPDSKLAVPERGLVLYLAGDEEAQPYREGSDYTVQKTAAGLKVARAGEGSAIPEGQPVVVEFSTDADPLRFASLYVYSYSAPYGIEPGTRICSVLGGVTEFLGLTEVGFPSYRVYREGGSTGVRPERPYNDEQAPDPRDDDTFIFVECELEHPTWQGKGFVPAPVVLRAADVPGAEIPIAGIDPKYNERHMKIDPYESALVQADNLTLPTMWHSCDLDGSRQVDRCYDQDREEGRCLPNQMEENDCEMACATEGIIGLRQGQTKADFASCTEITNYDNFGQFVVTMTDADGTKSRININTRLTVPDFDPRPLDGAHPWGRLFPGSDHERKVKSIRSVKGILYQLDSARPVWQIVPRSLEDIDFEFMD